MSTALLDTHVLAWLAGSPEKLTREARSFIEEAEALAISAVTAFEFEDLRIRGRLPGAASFVRLTDAFDLQLLAFPTTLWSAAAQLPPLHRDPVDRMLIAHAIHADLTLVSADADVRRYPVRTVW